MSPSRTPSANAGVEPQPLLFDERFLKRLSRLTLVTRQARAGQFQGERRSPKRGQSVEFADYRPYVPGDDFRQIDWHVYARLERFFVKLFVEEEDITVHLLVDTSRSMSWGTPSKLEMAVRLASAFGYIVLNGLDRVAAYAFGNGTQRWPARRGRRAAVSLFSWLHALVPSGTTQLVRAISQYAHKTTQPGPLLLFSDMLVEGWPEALRTLVARRFEVTLVHILSPEELDPPFHGDLLLRDCERDEGVEITLDGAMLARYRHHLATWRASIRRWCAERGVRYVFVSSDTPIEDVIFTHMVQYGVLR
ncbi:MAG: DUF58 domain-containing protein [Ardenticatenia bacterium]|nr:DUF58 domain-containing protein [Ardenticatenia bacterium]